MVDDSVYKCIADSTAVPCRFAAMYIRPQKLSVLLVAVYLISGAGLSDDNFLTFKQLNLLKQTLGLPLICYGYFNLTPEDLSISGRLASPGLTPIVPKALLLL